MPAVTLHELVESRPLKVEGAKVDSTLSYFAVGSADPADVYAAAVAGTPTGYSGGSRLAIDLKPVGGICYRFDVAYGTPTAERPELGPDTPTTLPATPPSADPADVPPVADPPVPLVPLEGQLGGPDGPGSFDPPGGGAGGGQGMGMPDTPDREQPLGNEWSFSTAGATVNVTQSILTPYGRAVGQDVTAPDERGAIGATKDGVAGVDVVTPALQLTCTRTVRYVTGGYVDAIAALTGTVNNAVFLWFAEGEVLFEGASGPYKAPGGWTITYTWLVRKNEDNVEVVPPDKVNFNALQPEFYGLVIPRKEGWQVLDVRYKADTPEDGNGNKKLTQRVQYAYVHSVYYKKDFSALGFE